MRTIVRWALMLAVIPMSLGCGGNEPAKVPDKEIPIIKDGPSVGGAGGKKEKPKPPAAAEK